MAEGFVSGWSVLDGDKSTDSFNSPEVCASSSVSTSVSSIEELSSTWSSGWSFCVVGKDSKTEEMVGLSTNGVWQPVKQTIVSTTNDL